MLLFKINQLYFETHILLTPNKVVSEILCNKTFKLIWNIGIEREMAIEFLKDLKYQDKFKRYHIYRKNFDILKMSMFSSKCQMIRKTTELTFDAILLDCHFAFVRCISNNNNNNFISHST